MQNQLNFQNRDIRTVEENGQTYYSIIDVISSLTDSSSPTSYWSTLKERLKKEGSQLVTNCDRLKMPAADGKMRQTDCADRETLLRLIQSIPSPSVEPFKQWLANAGEQNIQETENPLLLMDRLRDSLENKGYDSNWVDARIRSVVVRKQLTEEWKKRGVQENEYGILTNDIMSETFDLSVAEHKQLKGIVTQNLRDHMSNMELIFSMLGEETARQLSIQQDAQGFDENRDAAKQGGKLAGDSRKRLEKRIGVSVVTRNNHLGK